MRVAIDIGGTFTDLVSLDEETGRIGLAKSSTTPGNLADGVLKTLQLGHVDSENVLHFVHGSTVVINALLERKGAPTALLTTQGFRDVLEITRANRPDMYNFTYAKPTPFVPRRLRFEVEERVDAEGEVVVPLNEDHVRDAIGRIRKADVKALAVCYLHSYANPTHERQTGEILREEFPEATFTLSHELTKEWREYERTNTAVLNAYVKPLARCYLSYLERKLDALGIRDSRFAMQSNGGVMTFRGARRAPINMVESGPVGGVTGAAALARSAGISNVLTLDIGGTTAKTSLVTEGKVRIKTDYSLEATPYFAGYPLKVPVVDIVEIGAGGGSVAWIDQGGAPQVGPRSTGADPGPACYGKGGTDPTLTDAHLLAGRLNPDYFLGGKIYLDVTKAEQAVDRLADELRVTRREMALGIIRVANNNMAHALRMVSVRRGHDPRDFALVAMGGAGGLHAASLARGLGAHTVLIPRAPAHFSSWGMLMTDLRQDAVRTRVVGLSRDTMGQLNGLLRQLEEEAVDRFAAESLHQEGLRLAYSIDLRYVGQEHTVKVPLPSGILDEEVLTKVRRQFHELHESHYTFRLSDPLEVVNLHLTVLRPLPKPNIEPLPKGDETLDNALKGRRSVDFDDGGILETPVYERERLPLNAPVKGPAVVEEPASTTVVHPHQRFKVDRFGNLVIQTGAPA